MKMPPRQTHVGSILKLLLLLMMFGLAFVLSVGAMVYLSVRPTRDFRELQDAVLDELPQSPNMRVSVRAPSVLVSLARFGLSFVDDVDNEARLALRAVHGGELGVLQLPRPVSRADKIRIKNRADETMEKNNWTRNVAVVNRDEMVLVYTREGADSPENLEVLTLVFGNDKLIMVSARGDLRPIWELAQTHIDEVSTGFRREFN